MALDRRQFLAGSIALGLSALLDAYPGLANGTVERIKEFQRNLRGKYQFFTDKNRTKAFSALELATFGEALDDMRRIQSDLDAHYMLSRGKDIAPYVVSKEFPELTFHGEYNGFYVKDRGVLFHVLPYHAVKGMAPDTEKTFLASYVREPDSDFAVHMGYAPDHALASRADFNERSVPILPKGIPMSQMIGAVAVVSGYDMHGAPVRTHSLVFPISRAILKAFGLPHTDDFGTSILETMWMPLPSYDAEPAEGRNDGMLRASGRSGSSVRVLLPASRRFIPMGAFLNIRAQEHAGSHFPEVAPVGVGSLEQLRRGIALARKKQGGESQ